VGMGKENLLRRVKDDRSSVKQRTQRPAHCTSALYLTGTVPSFTPEHLVFEQTKIH
jgi:hypothetical protein